VPKFISYGMLTFDGEKYYSPGDDIPDLDPKVGWALAGIGMLFDPMPTPPAAAAEPAAAAPAPASA